MSEPQASTIDTPAAFDGLKTYDTTFAEVVAEAQRDVNLVIHSPGTGRIRIDGVFNFAMIEANCPLLTAGEFRKEGPVYKGFLEVPSPEVAICFLRYMYTEDYMMHVDGDATLGDRIFREPRSVLVDVQIYNLAKKYDLPQLRDQAYANLIEKTEQSCSTPFPPAELTEAITYLYEYMRQEKRLIEILLHYSVGCFFYHRLGERGDFINLVVNTPYFNNDLIRTNHERKFDTPAAAMIIQMPLAVRRLDENDHTHIADFFWRTLRGDETPYSYTEEEMTGDGDFSDYGWNDHFVPQDRDLDFYTSLPLRPPPPYESSGEEWKPFVPRDEVKTEPLLGQPDRGPSHSYGEYNPFSHGDDTPKLDTELPLRPRPTEEQSLKQLVSAHFRSHEDEASGNDEAIALESESASWRGGPVNQPGLDATTSDSISVADTSSSYDWLKAPGTEFTPEHIEFLDFAAQLQRGLKNARAENQRALAQHRSRKSDSESEEDGGVDIKMEDAGTIAGPSHAQSENTPRPKSKAEGKRPVAIKQEVDDDLTFDDMFVFDEVKKEPEEGGDWEMIKTPPPGVNP